MKRSPQLIKNLLLYEGGLEIDSDGSPRSYGPNNSGLDFTANAGAPGNWYGIATDQLGQPIIQGANDPYPGFYVSTTSLQDHSKQHSDPNRYVNSETIPYISVASDLIKRFGVMMGDIAAIYYRSSAQLVFAIVADAGPHSKYGEGSIFLANALKIDSSPRRGGCSDGVITIIFLNSHSSWPLENTIIDEIGNSLLNQNGGINSFL